MKKFLFLFALIFLASCSSGGSPSRSPQALNDSSASADGALRESEVQYEESYETKSYYEDQSYPADTEEKSEKKKIIQAYATIQTENYIADYEEIKNVAINEGGYVESASSNSAMNADLVLRIPAENYERAKNAITSIGKLLSFSENSEDVTQEYSDISMRLALKKTEEERILAMVAEQPELTEKIRLEQRLADVRAEIYYYDARIKSIDDLSAFSTLNVSLTQVAGTLAETEKGFDERLYAAFKSSLASASTAIENVVLFFAGSFFQLIILALVLALVVLAAKNIKKDLRGN